MTDTIQLFRAPDMQGAIARVRQALGPDALILMTRRVDGGMEITAAIERPAAAEPAAPEPWRDGLAWHGAPPGLLTRMPGESLREAVAFTTLDLSPDARPLLLAGPPGGGKTLSVARLATRLVLGGTTPMVITTDAVRAGATEQLAAFTRLLGVALVVADTPTLLRRALARRPAGAAVLIDTAGMDPFAADARDQLQDLASASTATLAAVLPAGMDGAETGETAEIYAALGAQALIATRLDLARRRGSILWAAEAGLALAEAGIGPGAADGLVPFTPSLLCSIFGLQRLAPAQERAHGGLLLDEDVDGPRRLPA